jgi:hypothetical protein
VPRLGLNASPLPSAHHARDTRPPADRTLRRKETSRGTSLGIGIAAIGRQNDVRAAGQKNIFYWANSLIGLLMGDAIGPTLLYLANWVMYYIHIHGGLWELETLRRRSSCTGRARARPIGRELPSGCFPPKLRARPRQRVYPCMRSALLLLPFLSRSGGVLGCWAS